MKIIQFLIAAAALLYTSNAMTEQTQTAWWQDWVMGAPCSLQTDIDEGTCVLEVKQKPRIRKK